jgi:hypothetical protein
MQVKSLAPMLGRRPHPAGIAVAGQARSMEPRMRRPLSIGLRGATSVGPLAATLLVGAFDDACSSREKRVPEATASVRSALTVPNVVTYAYDNSRSGTNSAETLLTQSNVSSRSFGRLFRLQVDDNVFAQVLYVAGVTPPQGGQMNVAYIATMNNTVFAYDADNGGLLWSQNYTCPPGNPSCGFRVPIAKPPPTPNVPTDTCDGSIFSTPPGTIGTDIGILGTPVIDPSAGTMYFVTAAIETGDTFRYRLRAIDIATGNERSNSGAFFKASGFTPMYHMQRAALTLSGGYLYVPFSGMCEWDTQDAGRWHGWMFAYDASTLNFTGGVDTSPNDEGASIWQSGSGPAADASGNIYVATGNELADTNPSLSDYGVSVLKLTPGTAQISDYFMPPDHAKLNGGKDLDLSAGPRLIPGTDGLLVAGGKSGKAYVLSTASLGGQNHMTSVQTFPASPGSDLHGMSLWSGPFGVNLYAWGEFDLQRAYRWNGSGFDTAAFAIAPTGTPHGNSFTVSANGSQSGTGILWSLHQDAMHNNAGTLTALNAEGDGQGNLPLIWSSSQHSYDVGFTVPGFTPPMVVNGQVYVSSFGNAPSSNYVTVFAHRPPPNPVWNAFPAADCASAVGSGWVIGCETGAQEGVYHNAPLPYGWTQISGAHATSVSVDLNGDPWVVNAAGQIYKWSRAQQIFVAFGGSFCAKNVASGTQDGETWAIRCDNAVAYWNGTSWSVVPGAIATKVAFFSIPPSLSTCGAHTPFVINAQQQVYEFVYNGCLGGTFQAVPGAFAADITTDFVLDRNGNIDQWSPSAGTFVSYIGAPWGTNSLIGSGPNGLYAISTAPASKGAIQVVDESP